MIQSLQQFINEVQKVVLQDLMENCIYPYQLGPKQKEPEEIITAIA
jgi:hypothetical protein